MVGLVRRVVAADGHLHPGGLYVMALGLMASAGVTEWLGVHLVIGSFLFGVAASRALPARAADDLDRTVSPITEALLLPAFFVLAGSGIDLDAAGHGSLATFACVGLAAIGSKLLGSYLGGRAAGLDTRRAGAVAVLMNTRGLTEIVVLDTGRQAGLLGPVTYSIMMLVALASTAATGPLMALLDRRRPARTPAAAHQRSSASSA